MLRLWRETDTVAIARKCSTHLLHFVIELSLYKIRS